MKFINIGYENYVNADNITAITQPNSAPILRRIRNAAPSELIDCTMGRRTASVIFTKDNRVILSAIVRETLVKRVER